MQLPDDLPFPDWVVHVFDHPVADPEWHWADDAPFWDPGPNPSRTVAYLTRLFREPEIHLAPFTPEQINKGLWYLINPARSSHAFSVLDPRVPLEERTGCVRAVFDLYVRCFARLCTHHYGHLDFGPELPSPVNSICYMFWDLFPVWPRSRLERDPGLKPPAPDLKPLDPEARRQHAAIEEACLDVMERTLELDHPACKEGALHGLSHFQHGYGRRVQRTVDAFLRRQGPALTPELRAYARQARSGAAW